MGGDFNAKNTYRGSSLNTPKGNEFYKAMGNPTYWPTDSSKTINLIDFFK